MNEKSNSRILQATLRDCKRMAELGREIVLESFGDNYSEQDLADHIASNYTVGRYRDQLERPQTCLLYAEESGVLKGYALGYPCSLPIDTEGKRAYELRRLYVRQNAKGSGIALQLLHEFVNWTKNAGYERLYVGIWEGNHRDRAYKRYGFKLVGKHSFQVGNQIDTDLILMKEL